MSSAAPNTRRRRWAREIIDRGTSPRVSYGSTEWLCLPDDDPNKLAAAVICAELYAEDHIDNLEANLEREIEQGRRLIKTHEDATHQAEQESWREYAKGLHSARPSFVERRKAQLLAAQPRPGDFPGRGGAGA